MATIADIIALRAMVVANLVVVAVATTAAVMTEGGATAAGIV
jgi:hypothetical protein